MPTDLAVADLLEQEEKKALERRQQARRQNGHSSKNSREDGDDWRMRDFIPLDDESSPKSRDPRRHGAESRHSSDRASANGSVSSRRRSLSVGRQRGTLQFSNSRSRSRSPDNHHRRGGNVDRYRTRDDDDRKYGRSRGSRDDRGRYYEDRYRGDDHDDGRHYRPSGGHRGDGDRGRYDDDRRTNGHGHQHESSKKQKTPEPTDDERDRRTVFVQQLAARLRTKELKEFFTRVGAVSDAQIVKDRVSGRSKGVGYVEFKEEESVQKALALTGQKLLGIPIIVQLTEAEKNRQARQNEGVATHSNGLPFHRLYVGNIMFSISEDDLRSLFESFGELDFVQLQKSEDGRSKGYGFVQFTDPADAKDALEKMNGFELAGRPIRVGLGSGNQAMDKQHREQGSSFSGIGGRGQHAGGASNFDRAGGRDIDKTGGSSALDDNDVNGASFSNVSRASLMAKLARTEQPEQETVHKKKQATAAVEKVIETRCVCIKNMWTEEDTTEPGWQKEMEAEVGEECSNKYGTVKHIAIDPSSQFGEIYVKFDSTEGGKKAYQGLNGRFFSARVITAHFVVDAVYNSLFPKAANL